MPDPLIKYFFIERRKAKRNMDGRISDGPTKKGNRKLTVDLFWFIMAAISFRNSPIPCIWSKQKTENNVRISELDYSLHYSGKIRTSQADTRGQNRSAPVRQRLKRQKPPSISSNKLATFIFLTNLTTHTFLAPYLGKFSSPYYYIYIYIY